MTRPGTRLHPRRRRSGASLACLLVSLGLGSCIDRDITQPSAPASRVEIDATERGTVAPGTSRSFVFPVERGDPYQLSVRVADAQPSDSLEVAVLDLVANGTILERWVATGLTPDEWQRLPWFQYDGPNRLLVRVTNRRAAGRAVDFELRTTSTPSTARVGETVQGAVFGRRRDYTLEAAAGTEVIVLLQPTRIRSGSNLTVSVQGGGNALGTTQAPAAPDAPLGTFSTGRIVLAGAPPYVVRVEGSGEFTLQTRAIERRPETAPGTITLGVPVREAIDHKGDVDEFRFTAPAGAELVLQLIKQGPGQNRIRAEVMRGADTLAAIPAVALNCSMPIDCTHSLRFPAPAAGEYIVRVNGDVAPGLAEATGEYELEVYSVSRLPETAAATLPPQAWVTGERIDRVGDVDEFGLEVAADTLVAVSIRGTAAEEPAGPFQLTVIDPAGAPVTSFVTRAFSSQDDTYPLQTLRLARGRHRVRVEAVRHGQEPWGEVRHHRGAYDIGAWVVGRGPESAPRDVRLGQAITTEALNHPGDIDTFTFTTTEVQELAILLRDLGTPVEVTIDPIPVGWPLEAGILARRVRFIAAPELMQAAPLPRITAWPGTYTLTVRHQHTFAVVDGARWEPGLVAQTRGSGRYELLVFPISRLPENVPARLPQGRVVTGEVIFPVGDIDDFDVHLEEGKEYSLAYRATNTWVGDSLDFRFPAPPPLVRYEFGERSGVAQASDAWFRVHEGERFRADGTGVRPLLIEVLGGAEDRPKPPVPYEVVLNQIRRSPETVAAQIAIGDTIADERMDVFGDVDEFSFTAAAGDRLRLELAAEPVILLELFDPAGRPVSSVWTRWGSPVSSEIVLERSGSYRLTVSTGTWPGPATEPRPYRFSVTRVP